MESTGVNYFCAVDGSVMADIATELVMKDMQRDNDNVIIAHISDRSKNYLPMKMRPHYIKMHYDTAIITHNKPGFYCEEDVQPDKSSK